jgi:hypothetical protein
MQFFQFKKLKLRLYTFFLLYSLSIAITITAIFILFLSRNFLSREDALIFFGKIIWRFFSGLYFHIAVLLLTLLFYVFKSLIQDFKNGRINGLVKGISLKLVTPSLLLASFYFGVNYYRSNENFESISNIPIKNSTGQSRDKFAIDGKQRGIHVFNLRSDSTDLALLVEHNFEWVTFSPFIHQEKYDKPSIYQTPTINTEYWQFVRRQADLYSFRVMIKPHIWLTDQTDGIWHSNINMSSVPEWNEWFIQYSGHILAYAAMAEKHGFEQFCIGTELFTPLQSQPQQWLDLLANVRKIYSGKITYAANWSDDLSKNPLWSHLDYIGIQAYFPIAENENPSLSELESGWRNHLQLLNELSKKHNKRILFTEVGYKSTENAGVKPWEWDTFSNRFYKRISKKTQYLCYQALFNVVWDQPWFAGVHIWEWQNRGISDGNNNDFTLENKPALNAVAKGFHE